MKSDSESMDDQEEGEKKGEVESEKPVFVLPDPPAPVPAVVRYVSHILCCPDLFLCIFHKAAGLTFALICICYT